MCDVGSGAGFPGLVLKICFPQLNLTLIESQKKKADFLIKVIKELNLNKTEVVNERVEDYTKRYREYYDYVTIRAVGNLNLISECCLPLLKVGGCLIAMKGKLGIEIDLLKPTLKKLNSNILIIETFKLPIINHQRSLVVIKKEQKTNLKYPRPFSQIKKKPL